MRAFLCANISRRITLVNLLWNNPLRRMSKITTFTHFVVCCKFFRSKPIIFLSNFCGPTQGRRSSEPIGSFNRLNPRFLHHWWILACECWRYSDAISRLGLRETQPKVCLCSAFVSYLFIYFLTILVRPVIIATTVLIFTRFARLVEL